MKLPSKYGLRGPHASWKDSCSWTGCLLMTPISPDTLKEWCAPKSSPQALECAL